MVDFNWDAPHFIGLGEGVDDVELPQLFRRHLDEHGNGIGVIVGLLVPEERVAHALVDCVDRGFIGHGAIVSERGAALGRMTGNGLRGEISVKKALNARLGGGRLFLAGKPSTPGKAGNLSIRWLRCS